MYTKDDCIKIVDMNGNIIASGFVKGIKDRYTIIGDNINHEVKFNCVSFDNRYFFSLKSKNFTIQSNDEKIIKEFDYNNSNLNITLWRDIIDNPYSDVYRDFDYSEIDSEILSLCNALNSIDGIETQGSCCGHNKHNPWVDIIFNNVSSLQLLLKIIYMKKFSNWYLISERRFICNEYSGNTIGLTLKCNLKGEEAYREIELLSKCILTLTEI